ncbi:MAG: metallophosphoesterase N-terminal domain-containing protein, partial [Bacteroidales bacterium]|nr:metallophosphoesterase N-terminal domain-containing protein [Bacteroidales bacterium]
MKRLVTLSFIIVFTLYSTLTWAITIKGRVTAGGTPLAGVVVTDGENFTVTGKGGVYSLESGSRSKFVYLSLPSGYSAPVEDGVVKFYIPLEREKKRSYDFSLIKKGEDDNRHGFIAMADPQIYSAKEFALLEEGVADIRETVQSYNLPFHGIAAGDLISHDHTLYPQYN